MLELTSALRSLWRTPSSTVTAVVTLAFGIGVTTAVFLVVNAAVLQPLPYQRPEQLVELTHEYEVSGVPAGVVATSWAELHFWRSREELFAGTEAYEIVGAPMVWRERAVSLPRGRVTSGLPSLLGLSPVLGRVFTRDEAETEAAVVLISEDLWRREFGRDPSVVGSTLTLDDRVYAVIGVMPSTFRYGPAGGGRNDVWTGLPERATAADLMPATMVMARLQDGISLVEANAHAQAVPTARLRELAPVYPQFQASPIWTPRLNTLDDWRARIAKDITLSPLLALLCTGGLLLMIACTNVANLLIARGGSRRDELRTRAALGASRGRLIALLLVEGAVLTVVAASVGVGVALGAVSLSNVLMPAELRLLLFEVSTPVVDWRVVGFVLLVSAVTALLASLGPALWLSRTSLSTVGRSRVAQGAYGGRSGRSGRVLQIAQVVLALVLVIGAGLMARAALPSDLGFDAAHLGAVVVTLPAGSDADAGSQLREADALVVALRAMPGVEATLGRPPSDSRSSLALEVEGRPRQSGFGLAVRSGIAPDYFDMVGMTLMAGRRFGATDVLGAPPVVIVDQAAARAWFGDGPVVGQRIRFGADGPFSEIVGVVNTATTASVDRAGPKPGIYTPWAQAPSRTVSLVIKTDRNLATVMGEAGVAIAAANPDAEVVMAEPVMAAFERSATWARARFVATLVTVFAVLALLTAGVGLFSMLSASVQQRQREIGVRMALGASASAVRGLVARHAAAAFVPGVLLGWSGALLVMRVVSSQLYGVAPNDPAVYLGAALVMLAAGLAATIGPIRRAVRVNPIDALRAE